MSLPGAFGFQNRAELAAGVNAAWPEWGQRGVALRSRWP
jgi:hypothetical protein